VRAASDCDARFDQRRCSRSPVKETCVSMISWFDRAMFAALLTGAVVATAPIAEAGYTAVIPPSR